MQFARGTLTPRASWILNAALIFFKKGQDDHDPEDCEEDHHPEPELPQPKETAAVSKAKPPVRPIQMGSSSASS